MSSFNQIIFHFIYAANHRSELLDIAGIFSAQYLPYLLVLGFLVLIYYQQGSRRRVYLFCEGVLAIILARGLITEIIRYFYHEQRPFSFYNFTPLINEGGWSFPSAHAAWFFALAVVVWYVNRKWGWWYLALALVMGVARVYAGVHWPLDVVGGAVVGVLSAMFIHWLLLGVREKLQSKHPNI